MASSFDSIKKELDQHPNAEPGGIWNLDVYTTDKFTRASTRRQAKELFRIFHKTPQTERRTRSFISQARTQLMLLKFYNHGVFMQKKKYPRTIWMFHLLCRFVALEYESLGPNPDPNKCEGEKLILLLETLLSEYFDVDPKIRCKVFIVHIIVTAFNIYKIPQWYMDLLTGLVLKGTMIQKQLDELYSGDDDLLYVGNFSIFNNDELKYFREVDEFGTDDEASSEEEEYVEDNEVIIIKDEKDTSDCDSTHEFDDSSPKIRNDEKTKILQQGLGQNSTINTSTNNSKFGKQTSNIITIDDESDDSDVELIDCQESFFSRVNNKNSERRQPIYVVDDEDNENVVPRREFIKNRFGFEEDGDFIKPLQEITLPISNNPNESFELIKEPNSNLQISNKVMNDERQLNLQISNDKQNINLQKSYQLIHANNDTFKGVIGLLSIRADKDSLDGKEQDSPIANKHDDQSLVIDKQHNINGSPVRIVDKSNTNTDIDTTYSQKGFSIDLEYNLNEQNNEIDINREDTLVSIHTKKLSSPIELISSIDQQHPVPINCQQNSLQKDLIEVNHTSLHDSTEGINNQYSSASQNDTITGDDHNVEEQDESTTHDIFPQNKLILDVDRQQHLSPCSDLNKAVNQFNPTAQNEITIGVTQSSTDKNNVDHQKQLDDDITSHSKLVEVIDLDKLDAQEAKTSVYSKPELTRCGTDNVLSPIKSKLDCSHQSSSINKTPKHNINLQNLTINNNNAITSMNSCTVFEEVSSTQVISDNEERAEDKQVLLGEKSSNSTINEILNSDAISDKNCNTSGEIVTQLSNIVDKNSGICIMSGSKSTETTKKSTYATNSGIHTKLSSTKDSSTGILINAKKNTLVLEIKKTSLTSGVIIGKPIEDHGVNSIEDNPETEVLNKKDVSSPSCKITVKDNIEIPLTIGVSDNVATPNICIDKTFNTQHPDCLQVGEEYSRHTLSNLFDRNNIGDVNSKQIQNKVSFANTLELNNEKHNVFIKKISFTDAENSSNDDAQLPVPDLRTLDSQQEEIISSTTLDSNSLPLKTSLELDIKKNHVELISENIAKTKEQNNISTSKAIIVDDTQIRLGFVSIGLAKKNGQNLKSTVSLESGQKELNSSLTLNFEDRVEDTDQSDVPVNISKQNKIESSVEGENVLKSNLNLCEESSLENSFGFTSNLVSKDVIQNEQRCTSNLTPNEGFTGCNETDIEATFNLSREVLVKTFNNELITSSEDLSTNENEVELDSRKVISIQDDKIEGDKLLQEIIKQDAGTLEVKHQGITFVEKNECQNVVGFNKIQEVTFHGDYEVHQEESSKKQKEWEDTIKSHDKHKPTNIDEHPSFKEEKTTNKEVYGYHFVETLKSNDNIIDQGGIKTLTSNFIESSITLQIEELNQGDEMVEKEQLTNSKTNLSINVDKSSSITEVEAVIGGNQLHKINKGNASMCVERETSNIEMDSGAQNQVNEIVEDPLINSNTDLSINLNINNSVIENETIGENQLNEIITDTPTNQIVAIDSTINKGNTLTCVERETSKMLIDGTVTHESSYKNQGSEIEEEEYLLTDSNTDLSINVNVSSSVDKDETLIGENQLHKITTDHPKNQIVIDSTITETNPSVSIEKKISKVEIADSITIDIGLPMQGDEIVEEHQLTNYNANLSMNINVSSANEDETLIGESQLHKTITDSPTNQIVITQNLNELVEENQLTNSNTDLIINDNINTSVETLMEENQTHKMNINVSSANEDETLIGESQLHKTITDSPTNQILITQNLNELVEENQLINSNTDLIINDNINTSVETLLEENQTHKIITINDGNASVCIERESSNIEVNSPNYIEVPNTSSHMEVINEICVNTTECDNDIILAANGNVINQECVSLTNQDEICVNTTTECDNDIILAANVNVINQECVSLTNQDVASNSTSNQNLVIIEPEFVDNHHNLMAVKSSHEVVEHNKGIIDPAFVDNHHNLMADESAREVLEHNMGIFWDALELIENEGTKQKPQKKRGRKKATAICTHVSRITRSTSKSHEQERTEESVEEQEMIHQTRSKNAKMKTIKSSDKVDCSSPNEIEDDIGKQMKSQLKYDFTNMKDNNVNDNSPKKGRRTLKDVDMSEVKESNNMEKAKKGKKNNLNDGLVSNNKVPKEFEVKNDDVGKQMKSQLKYDYTISNDNNVNDNSPKRGRKTTKNEVMCEVKESNNMETPKKVKRYNLKHEVKNLNDDLVSSHMEKIKRGRRKHTNDSLKLEVTYSNKESLKDKKSNRKLKCKKEPTSDDIFDRLKASDSVEKVNKDIKMLKEEVGNTSDDKFKFNFSNSNDEAIQCNTNLKSEEEVSNTSTGGSKFEGSKSNDEKFEDKKGRKGTKKKKQLKNNKHSKVIKKNNRRNYNYVDDDDTFGDEKIVFQDVECQNDFKSSNKKVKVMPSKNRKEDDNNENEKMPNLLNESLTSDRYMKNICNNENNTTGTVDKNLKIIASLENSDSCEGNLVISDEPSVSLSHKEKEKEVKIAIKTKKMCEMEIQAERVPTLEEVVKQKTTCKDVSKLLNIDIMRDKLIDDERKIDYSLINDDQLKSYNETEFDVAIMKNRKIKENELDHKSSISLQEALTHVKTFIKTMEEQDHESTSNQPSVETHLQMNGVEQTKVIEIHQNENEALDYSLSHFRLLNNYPLIHRTIKNDSDNALNEKTTQYVNKHEDQFQISNKIEEQNHYFNGNQRLSNSSKKYYLRKDVNSIKFSPYSINNILKNERTSTKTKNMEISSKLNKIETNKEKEETNMTVKDIVITEIENTALKQLPTNVTDDMNKVTLDGTIYNNIKKIDNISSTHIDVTFSEKQMKMQKFSNLALLEKQPKVVLLDNVLISPKKQKKPTNYSDGILNSFKIENLSKNDNVFKSNMQEKDEQTTNVNEIHNSLFKQEEINYNEKEIFKMNDIGGIREIEDKNLQKLKTLDTLNTQQNESQGSSGFILNIKNPDVDVTISKIDGQKIIIEADLGEDEKINKEKKELEMDLNNDENIDQIQKSEDIGLTDKDNIENADIEMNMLEEKSDVIVAMVKKAEILNETHEEKGRIVSKKCNPKKLDEIKSYLVKSENDSSKVLESATKIIKIEGGEIIEKECKTMGAEKLTENSLIDDHCEDKLKCENIQNLLDQEINCKRLNEDEGRKKSSKSALKYSRSLSNNKYEEKHLNTVETSIVIKTDDKLPKIIKKEGHSAIEKIKTMTDNKIEKDNVTLEVESQMKKKCSKPKDSKFDSKIIKRDHQKDSKLKETSGSELEIRVGDNKNSKLKNTTTSEFQIEIVKSKDSKKQTKGVYVSESKIKTKDKNNSAKSTKVIKNASTDFSVKEMETPTSEKTILIETSTVVMGCETDQKTLKSKNINIITSDVIESKDSKLKTLTKKRSSLKVEDDSNLSMDTSKSKESSKQKKVIESSPLFRKVNTSEEKHPKMIEEEAILKKPTTVSKFEDSYNLESDCKFRRSSSRTWEHNEKSYNRTHEPVLEKVKDSSTNSDDILTIKANSEEKKHSKEKEHRNYKMDVVLVKNKDVDNLEKVVKHKKSCIKSKSDKVDISSENIFALDKEVIVNSSPINGPSDLTKEDTSRKNSVKYDLLVDKSGICIQDKEEMPMSSLKYELNDLEKVETFRTSSSKSVELPILEKKEQSKSSSNEKNSFGLSKNSRKERKNSLTSKCSDNKKHTKSESHQVSKKNLEVLSQKLEKSEIVEPSILNTMVCVKNGKNNAPIVKSKDIMETICDRIPKDPKEKINKKESKSFKLNPTNTVETLRLKEIRVESSRNINETLAIKESREDSQETTETVNSKETLNVKKQSKDISTSGSERKSHKNKMYFKDECKKSEIVDKISNTRKNNLLNKNQENSENKLKENKIKIVISEKNMRKSKKKKLTEDEISTSASVLNQAEMTTLNIVQAEDFCKRESSPDFDEKEGELRNLRKIQDTIRVIADNENMYNEEDNKISKISKKRKIFEEELLKKKSQCSKLKMISSATSGNVKEIEVNKLETKKEEFSSKVQTSDFKIETNDVIVSSLLDAEKPGQGSKNSETLRLKSEDIKDLKILNCFQDVEDSKTVCAEFNGHYENHSSNSHSGSIKRKADDSDNKSEKTKQSLVVKEKINDLPKNKNKPGKEVWVVVKDNQRPNLTGKKLKIVKPAPAIHLDQMIEINELKAQINLNEEVDLVNSSQDEIICIQENQDDLRNELSNLVVNKSLVNMGESDSMGKREHIEKLTNEIKERATQEKTDRLHKNEIGAKVIEKDVITDSKNESTMQINDKDTITNTATPNVFVEHIGIIDESNIQAQQFPYPANVDLSNTISHKQTVTDQSNDLMPQPAIVDQTEILLQQPGIIDQSNIKQSAIVEKSNALGDQTNIITQPLIGSLNIVRGSSIVTQANVVGQPNVIVEDIPQYIYDQHVIIPSSEKVDFLDTKEKLIDNNGVHIPITLEDFKPIINSCSIKSTVGICGVQEMVTDTPPLDVDERTICEKIREQGSYEVKIATQNTTIPGGPCLSEITINKENKLDSSREGLEDDSPGDESTIFNFSEQVCEELPPIEPPIVDNTSDFQFPEQDGHLSFFVENDLTQDGCLINPDTNENMFVPSIYKEEKVDDKEKVNYYASLEDHYTPSPMSIEVMKIYFSKSSLNNSAGIHDNEEQRQNVDYESSSRSMIDTQNHPEGHTFPYSNLGQAQVDCDKLALISTTLSQESVLRNKEPFNSKTINTMFLNKTKEQNEATTQTKNHKKLGEVSVVNIQKLKCDNKEINKGYYHSVENIRVAPEEESKWKQERSKEKGVENSLKGSSQHVEEVSEYHWSVSERDARRSKRNDRKRLISQVDSDVNRNRNAKKSKCESKEEEDLFDKVKKLDPKTLPLVNSALAPGNTRGEIFSDVKKPLPFEFSTYHSSEASYKKPKTNIIDPEELSESFERERKKKPIYKLRPEEDKFRTHSSRHYIPEIYTPRKVPAHTTTSEKYNTIIGSTTRGHSSNRWTNSHQHRKETDSDHRMSTRSHTYIPADGMHMEGRQWHYGETQSGKSSTAYGGFLHNRHSGGPSEMSSSRTRDRNKRDSSCANYNRSKVTFPLTNFRVGNPRNQLSDSYLSPVDSILSKPKVTFHGNRN